MEQQDKPTSTDPKYIWKAFDGNIKISEGLTEQEVLTKVTKHFTELKSKPNNLRVFYGENQVPSKMV